MTVAVFQHLGTAPEDHEALKTMSRQGVRRSDEALIMAMRTLSLPGAPRGFGLEMARRISASVIGELMPEDADW